MPEFYTKEDFSKHLNTKFSIPTDAPGVFELELIEVVSTLSTPRQEQFSIFFRGPLNIFLPQATYHFQHEGMGEVDLFLVPIGKEEDGFRYEAVFNRAIEAD